MISMIDTVIEIYDRTKNKNVVINAYNKKMITAEEYEEILGEVVYEKTLEGAKFLKISTSKLMLAEFLESHPITSSCHGGEPAVYSVTEEKQNMFSRKFSAHMALVQAGIASTMTWNATGEPCEVWTDAEAIQFIAEINAYVTPLVSYQQHLEVEINSCETVEAVEAIVIDFDSVFTA